MLRGSTGPRGLHRAWTVVSWGLAIFLLSLVPLLLAQTDLPPATIWRAASALALVTVIGVILLGLEFDRRLTERGHPPQAMPLLRFAQALQVLGAVALAANGVGWPFPPDPFLE